MYKGLDGTWAAQAVAVCSNCTSDSRNKCTSASAEQPGTAAQPIMFMYNQEGHAVASETQCGRTAVLPTPSTEKPCPRAYAPCMPMIQILTTSQTNSEHLLACVPGAAQAIRHICRTQQSQPRVQGMRCQQGRCQHKPPPETIYGMCIQCAI